VHTNGFSPKQLLACAHKRVPSKKILAFAHDFYNFFTISYENQKTSFAHTTKKREYNVFCTQPKKEYNLKKQQIPHLLKYQQLQELFFNLIKIT